MRWIPFLFLLYIAAALQAAAFLGIPSAKSEFPAPRIEYVLLLVVFYSFYADEQEAAFTGLAGGLAIDLLGPSDVLGTNVAAMGLVAAAIVKVRLSIFREQTVSRIIIAFLAVLAYALLVASIRWTVRDYQGMEFLRFLKLMLGNALYTGLAAPVFFWLMMKLKSVLGVGTHGQRTR